MLYKEAMSNEKNNEILKKLGFEEIFGMKAPSLYLFKTPIVLYSLDQEKIGEGQFINVIRTRSFYGIECGMLALDAQGSEFLDIKNCFASLEYAKSILETLDSAYMAKVKYRGEEYFVIDYLSPFEVGLNEFAVSDYHISDLRYARLDELEF
ncbi:MAG TPA: hypothetical protein PLZ43_15910 [bacterium]|nr:hypothetical protein [bacterium]